jgi:colicin import membrane protein
MAKATVGTKSRQAAQIRSDEVLASVEGLSMDSVTKNITDTQVEVQEQLAGLSAKLTEQLRVLRTIEEAITLKKGQLQQLHGIDSVATDIDTLNHQIEMQRQGWEEEQAAKKRQFAEQQSERNKQWARTEEEYQYKLAQEHKKLEDAFAYRIAQQERDNQQRQAELERTWAEREAELKKRENELTDLRAKVGEFPEVVKKEVNAAVAIATNSVKKEYETKMVLASKDSETNQKLASQEITALNATVAKLNTQLEDLKAQLEQARADVKEISAKALESASDRQAMQALQKVMEKEPSGYKQQK